MSLFPVVGAPSTPVAPMPPPCFLSSAARIHCRGVSLAWASAAALRRRGRESEPRGGFVATPSAPATPSSRAEGAGRRRPRSSAMGPLFQEVLAHDHAATDRAQAAPSSPSFAASADLPSGWSPLRDGAAHWLADARLAGEPSTDAISGSSTTITISLSSMAPDRPPSTEEIALLQKAFASFYGTSQRDVPQAYELLSQCIDVWEGTKQGGDEIAGLYRVRGDVNMDLYRPKEAEADYAKAIQYLEGPDGNKADSEELPNSRLGRARAVRSMGASATTSKALQASKDYEAYFNFISSLDGDEDAAASKSAPKGVNAGTAFSDAIIDGIQRNPYAAWEWGMVDRAARRYDRAAELHLLAAKAFEEIGDEPRSVICALDRGLDLASGLDDGGGAAGRGGGDGRLDAVRALETAIASDVGAKGRDVALLQRVVAKEGEARVALSGVLWGSNRKAAAETQYDTACARLDELNADYQTREADRVRKGLAPPARPRGASLGFSIDDIPGAEEASCSRFKNERFVNERLVWDEGLRAMVNRFLTLGR